MRINVSGPFDKSFNENAKAALLTHGAPEPMSSMAGIPSLQMLGKTKTGLVALLTGFTAGGAKMVLIDGISGEFRQEFEIVVRDGERLNGVVLAGDGDGFYVAKNLGLYRTPAPDAKAIVRLNIDGTLDLAFNFAHGVKDFQGIRGINPSQLHMFKDGGIFLFYEAPGTKTMMALHRSGSISWEAPIGDFYLPWATSQKKGPNKLIVDFISGSNGNTTTTEIFVTSKGIVRTKDEFEAFEKDAPYEGDLECSTPNTGPKNLVQGLASAVRYSGYPACVWKRSDKSQIVAGQLTASQGDKTYVNVAHFLPDGNLDQNFME